MKRVGQEILIVPVPRSVLPNLHQQPARGTEGGSAGSAASRLKERSAMSILVVEADPRMSELGSHQEFGDLE